MNNESKKYKVAGIPNVYTIVINAGEVDGVQYNGRFRILGGSEEILDPDTKEPLGSLDFIKATVKVIELYEKMCLCENVLRVPSMLESTMNILTSMYGDNRVSLDVNENQMGLFDDNETISIGDIAEYIGPQQTPRLISETITEDTLAE